MGISSTCESFSAKSDAEAVVKAGPARTYRRELWNRGREFWSWRAQPPIPIRSQEFPGRVTDRHDPWWCRRRESLGLGSPPKAKAGRHRTIPLQRYGSSLQSSAAPAWSRFAAALEPRIAKTLPRSWCGSHAHCATFPDAGIATQASGQFPAGERYRKTHQRGLETPPSTIPRLLTAFDEYM